MPQKTHLISLVMPVKNVAGYLADCITSILCQNHKNWELIIVDDHSTDDTCKVIERFSKIDDRIRRMDNSDHGIVPALQTGLKNIKGTFISRFDGDDTMPPGRLKLMHDALLRSESKTIVTGKVKYFSKEPVSEGYLNYEKWINDRIENNDHWDWVYRECVIASPNWLMRTQELLDIAGFDNLSYPEDYHLVLNWYKNNFQVTSIPETTLNWREHPERTSRNSEHYSQESFFRLKLQSFVTHQLNEKSLVIWGSGDKAKLTASILDELHVDFEWMDMSEHTKGVVWKSHKIIHFKQIENRKDFLLLLTVFPPKKQRLKLEKYLTSNGLEIGRDYWYL